MSVHAYNTLQLCKLDTQMLNPCEVQVSLSQNKYVAVLSSPVFTSPDILRIGKQKKKTTFCVRRTAYMEQSVRGKWVEVIHEQFLQGQVKIRRGVKWLLQQETGCLFSKQHLITLPASLLLLSLSFFPSALSHTINFTSLSIPKSSSFHAKARLVTSFFFFFFACWVSSLFYWGALQLSALNTCCRRPDATIWFQKSVHFPLCDTVNCDLAQMSLKKKKKKWVYCLKFFVFVVNQNVFSSCHLHKRFQAVMCYDTAMPLASLS